MVLSGRSKIALAILGFIILDAPQWFDAVIDLAERRSTAPYVSAMFAWTSYVSDPSRGWAVWVIRGIGAVLLGFVVYHVVMDRRASGRRAGRKVSARLMLFHKQGIDKVMNAHASTFVEQGDIDVYEKRWRKRLIAYMREAKLAPSDIQSVERISPYTPLGLGALVNIDSRDPESVMLGERNAKLRNEIAERLRRLKEIAQKIESPRV